MPDSDGEAPIRPQRDAQAGRNQVSPYFIDHNTILTLRSRMSTSLKTTILEIVGPVHHHLPS